MHVLHAGHDVAVGLKAFSEALDVVPEKNAVEDHAGLREEHFLQFVFFVDRVASETNLFDGRVLGDYKGENKLPVRVRGDFRVDIGEKALVVNRLDIVHDLLLIQLIADLGLHRPQDMRSDNFVVSFDPQGRNRLGTSGAADGEQNEAHCE